jgi:hypothetical protein
VSNIHSNILAMCMQCIRACNIRALHFGRDEGVQLHAAAALVLQTDRTHTGLVVLGNLRNPPSSLLSQAEADSWPCKRRVYTSASNAGAHASTGADTTWR